MYSPRTIPAIITACMLILASVACTGSTPEAASVEEPAAAPAETPTQASPPTDVPTEPAPAEATAEPDVCTPQGVIASLSSDLIKEQFVFVYPSTFVLGKGAQPTLVFWMIDYTFSLVGSSADPNVGIGIAASTALQFASRFEHSNPCLGEVFPYMMPVVVDPSYNGWISFTIPTGVLPEKIDMNDDALYGILQESVIPGYNRTTAPEPYGDVPAGACEWPKARQGLEAAFFPNSNGNTAFYFVRDPNGNNVYAYLDNTNVILAPADYLTEQVMQILDELACLHPAPDNLLLQTLGEGGMVGFSGRLPRAGIIDRDPHKFVEFP